MALRDDLKNKKYRNWVRAGLGLKIVKEGLEPFCNHLVTQQHLDILNNVKQKHSLSAVACGLCDVIELQPDHVQTKTRLCPLGQTHCNCLHSRWKTSCPNSVCGAIYDEIIKLHAYIAPNWKNTDARQWCTEPWAVAKCFINAPGYEHKLGATEFDCPGLLHLLINNMDFHQHIQCNIDGNDAFSKVLRHRNTIFHSGKMEVEDTLLSNYLDDMIEVMQDDKEIKGKEESKEAVKKLLELKQNQLKITTADDDSVEDCSKCAIEELGSYYEEMKKDHFIGPEVVTPTNFRHYILKTVIISWSFSLESEEKMANRECILGKLKPCKATDEYHNLLPEDLAQDYNRAMKSSFSGKHNSTAITKDSFTISFEYSTGGQL